ncbi:MAG TPA: extensin family protein [Xanthobacteraceae bacterium]
MVRGVRWYLVGSCGPLLLAALAGCSGWIFAQREPWRHDAEIACFNSGAVQEGTGRVRIAAITGPGICGADFPLKISVLGGSEALGYGDELRPPSTWRGAAAAGPVSVMPTATLACPITSALDRWIGSSVQGAAMRWFGEPVVEIRQISAYSCRGMNGDPHAQISEHAFGNALDIAAFTLADGRAITVKDGWNGSPEEQGFLRDVQAAACEEFTTVLAPGSNAFHYNHIHVDLMRRANGRHACDPSAVSGEAIAARARARFGARPAGAVRVTGSIGRPATPAARYAVPGADGVD